ncbi:MAG: glycosyltransferase family 2 protein [Gammaproteobacteria bacterium]|nr:glycosyltransferase family 2 protein [Gammaproteobacteria bacterium]
MKLIIQVPCFNEAQQLPSMLAQLPRALPGFDAVEWLVVDDGSIDDTSAVARQAGVDHVIRFAENRGLAHAFAAGLEACCRRGADVIVNVDADNQYRADFLPRLCAPVLAGRADIVVGCRPIARIEHFSPIKKLLQRLGSAVVRLISGADVEDATSGFRAYSRRAALALNVYSRYTYTLETLVQARQARLTVASVPVEVNPPVRPSRLMRGTGEYVRRSVATMLRSFVIYRPLRFFMVPSVLSCLAGVALGLRFLANYLSDGVAGNVQSLILAAILIVLGALCAVIGLVADLLSVNRRLLEDIQASNRRRDWQAP